MFVQRVVMPGSGAVSWTVLGADDVPIEPIDRFLGYLTGIERSPNTVRSYAHDLKDYFVFLSGRGLDWREVRLEDVGEFVAWLRLLEEGRRGAVAVLPFVEPAVGSATINRKLSALASFYTHQSRHGVEFGELLTTWQVGGGCGGWKPFLHHVSKHQPARRRTVGLKAERKIPRVLTVSEVEGLLDGCAHLRDRFLLALLWDSGMRIGEALGLRHADIVPAECTVTVVARDNVNGARAKSRSGRTIPVGAELIRLWGDYLHCEYGALDSDYVFVNLFAEPRGRAWGYPAVYDLVRRLRARTGIEFDPHWFRHTMATRLLRDGVSLEVVSKLLGHASVTTTSDIYGHLTPADARRALEAAGWFDAHGTEVSW